MRNLLLILVGIVDLGANAPYIRDILRGKTKPNAASWSTWVLVNGIAVTAALAAGGALNTVILAGSYFIGALVIFILGISHGTRRYTRFDGVCQAIALVGIVLWQLSHDPNIAILFAVLVDISSTTPTIRHAYRQPQEETWSTYLISGCGAFVTLCLASKLSVAALAIPTDFCVVNLLLALIILQRRKQLNIPNRK